MSRILVTGASGFIGRACVSLLAARGHEVHAVSSGQRPAVPGLTWHTVDLLEGDEVRRLVRAVRATHLLHLAWHPAHGDIWTTLDNEPWVIASIRLLRAFREAGGERAVATGSCGEYDWEQGLCVEDVTPLRPRTYYGACKAAVRDVWLGPRQDPGLSTAWARIFFVYGPGEHPDRLVASVINGLLRERVVPCTHGRQIRDYLHVADVAEGLVGLLESEATGAFNICSAEATRIVDIVGALGEMLRRPDLAEIGARAAAPHEPPIILGSNEKSRAAFGFGPRWSLERGLEDTVHWWSAALTEPASAAGAASTLRP